MDKRGQATRAAHKQPHTRKRKEPDQAATNAHDILRQKNIAAQQLFMQNLGLLEAAAEVSALAQAPKKARKAPQPRPAQVPTKKRRSSRNEGKEAVVYYAPPELAERLPKGPRNRTSKPKNASVAKCWPVYSPCAIAATEDAAHAHASTLSDAGVKVMTHSMVAGGFWCNMPQDYVRKFPVTESTRTWAFSNEHKPSNPASKPHWETPEGEERKWGVVWLLKDNGAGLSGGWRGFAIDHDLVPHDCLVLETVNNAGPKNHARAIKTLTATAHSEKLPAIRIHIFRVRNYEGTV